MKVYTKTGDKGSTALIGGSRVKKYDLRIECYGTVDEISAWIGLIRDQEAAGAYKDELVEIQDRLFTIASLLACDSNVDINDLPQVIDSDVVFLEKLIDNYTDIIPQLKSFLLSGGHTTISYCHIARTICRRAERRVIELAEKQSLPPIIVTYLNRLSDYLFVLSRKISFDLNIAETLWKPRL